MSQYFNVCVFFKDTFKDYFYYIYFFLSNSDKVTDVLFHFALCKGLIATKCWNVLFSKTNRLDNRIRPVISVEHLSSTFHSTRLPVTVIEKTRSVTIALVSFITPFLMLQRQTKYWRNQETNILKFHLGSKFSKKPFNK